MAKSTIRAFDIVGDIAVIETPTYASGKEDYAEAQAYKVSLQ